MKKLSLIIILLILPIFGFTHTFHNLKKNQIEFKVKANNYYEFKINLQGNTQYIFKLTGINIFTFRLIDPFGYKCPLYFSIDNQLILWEEIMDKGEYTIKIYSEVDNRIKMMWCIY